MHFIFKFLNLLFMRYTDIENIFDSRDIIVLTIIYARCYSIEKKAIMIL